MTEPHLISRDDLKSSGSNHSAMAQMYRHSISRTVIETACNGKFALNLIFLEFTP